MIQAPLICDLAHITNAVDLAEMCGALILQRERRIA
jgi:hypothetical protein